MPDNKRREYQIPHAEEILGTPKRAALELQAILARVLRGDEDRRPVPPMPPAIRPEDMPPEEDIRAIPGVFPPRR